MSVYYLSLIRRFSFMIAQSHFWWLAGYVLHRCFLHLLKFSFLSLTVFVQFSNLSREIVLASLAFLNMSFGCVR